MVLKVIYEQLKLQMRDLSYFGPRVFLRFASKSYLKGLGEVKTKHGPFFLRRAETDLSVLREIYMKQDYNIDKVAQGQAVRERYNQILSSGGTPVIVDAGANVGISSRYFSSRYPKAEIIAVEPDENTVTICRKNTLHFEKIRVVEGAIGSRAGFVNVKRIPGAACATSVCRADQGLPVYTIQGLVSEVKNGHLLIVKIDIEGFEDDLFSCNLSWIASAAAIIVEPHDWMLPGKKSSHSLQKSMLGSGRDIFVSGENIIWI